MQMLAANHTPNERSSDCNSDCGNNWQLRVAQSLEAERQLAAYTQFPQTRPDPARPDPTKNMTSNGKQRAITASDTTELRPKQKQEKKRRRRRRRGRTEGNLQDAEAVAHGRASWALKSPRCDEAAN